MEIIPLNESTQFVPSGNGEIELHSAELFQSSQ
jgi:hypothetical protein